MIEITAEAGSTCRGDINVAIELATAAREAGADSFKGIMSDPEELIAQPIEYEDKDLAEVIASYQFKDDDDWYKLAGHCQDIGIKFFVSVGTPNKVALAQSIGVDRLKIGGWDSRNFPLLKEAALTELPLELDIGAVIYGEVCTMLEYVRLHTDANIKLVYETHSPNESEYNLNSIPYLREYFELPVGFSSDTASAVPDALAVSLGAVSVEKRIRIDDTEERHHEDKALRASKWKNYVSKIRYIEDNPIEFGIGQPETVKSMLGYKGLYPSLADIKGKMKYFTSMVYDRNMKAGEVLTSNDLACRRPADGFSIYYDYLFLNKPLKRDVRRNDMVALEDV